MDGLTAAVKVKLLELVQQIGVYNEGCVCQGCLRDIQRKINDVVNNHITALQKHSKQ